eukprot:gene28264-42545_t
MVHRILSFMAVLACRPSAGRVVCTGATTDLMMTNRCGFLSALRVLMQQGEMIVATTEWLSLEVQRFSECCSECRGVADFVHSDHGRGSFGAARQCAAHRIAASRCASRAAAAAAQTAEGGVEGEEGARGALAGCPATCGVCTGEALVGDFGSGGMALAAVDDAERNAPPQQQQREEEGGQGSFVVDASGVDTAGAAPAGVATPMIPAPTAADVAREWREDDARFRRAREEEQTRQLQGIKDAVQAKKQSRGTRHASALDDAPDARPQLDPIEGFTTLADIMAVCSYADLPRSMLKTSKKQLFEHAFFIHQGLSLQDKQAMH